MKHLMKVLCCGVLAGGSLFGAQIIHNSTITVQPTNWSGNFLLPQFDPTLGTLNSIACRWWLTRRRR